MSEPKEVLKAMSAAAGAGYQMQTTIMPKSSGDGEDPVIPPLGDDDDQTTPPPPPPPPGGEGNEGDAPAPSSGEG